MGPFLESEAILGGRLGSLHFGGETWGRKEAYPSFEVLIRIVLPIVALMLPVMVEFLLETVIESVVGAIPLVLNFLELLKEAAVLRLALENHRL